MFTSDGFALGPLKLGMARQRLGTKWPFSCWQEASAKLLPFRAKHAEMMLESLFIHRKSPGLHNQTVQAHLVSPGEVKQHAISACRGFD